MREVLHRFIRAAFHQVRLLALLSGLGALSPVVAQVDTSQWQCEFCPFLSGYESEVEAGADYVSDDAFRFGSATGYDESGGDINLAGYGRYANDGYQAGWNAEDLGLESRRLGLFGARQGRYGLYLDYNELPYRRFDTTSTVYTAVTPDSLALPPGWVRDTQTSGFTALPTSLAPRSIESDRQTIGAGGHFLPTPNFTLFADYRHQERDGVDIVSGANFTQATLLPRFLDFETDTMDIGVGYNRDRLSLSLAWFGSFFRNNLNSLTWENAFTSPPGAEIRRMAQEPDNDFQQVALAGSYRGGLMNTVVTMNAAVGRGEQNEMLLPYTINPNIAAGALPGSSLDGQVDTANYALAVSSKPSARSRLKLSYRFDERDNQTSRQLWSRVIVDSFASGQPEPNTPYSFEKSSFSASGSYEILDRIRLSTGYDRTETDRDFQEVAEQTLDRGWGRVRWRISNWFDVNVKGGTEKRDIDRYDPTVASNLGQNPLMRKYNLAYRFREFGELTLGISPLTLPVTLGVTALWADDSYSQSEIGLTDSRTSHWNIDFSWALTDSASLYVFGGEEAIDAKQAGSDTFSAPDWFATHEDKFRIIGAGVQLDQIGDNTRLRLDLTRSDGETGIFLDRSGTSQSSYPDLESSLTSVRLTLSHRRSEKLDIDLSFRYESFDVKDWAIAGVEPDMIPVVLSLGADPYDYSIWVFGLSFRYLIGDRDVSLP